MSNNQLLFFYETKPKMIMSIETKLIKCQPLSVVEHKKLAFSPGYADYLEDHEVKYQPLKLFL